jgi:hypothetical protein
MQRSPGQVSDGSLRDCHWICFSPDMQTLKHTSPRASTLGRVMPKLPRYCASKVVRIPESRDTTALNRYPYVKRSLLDFGFHAQRDATAPREGSCPIFSENHANLGLPEVRLV